MHFKLQNTFLFISLLLLMSNTSSTTAKPITPEALYSVQRVSNFTISPDDKFILTLVTTPNLETNKMEMQLHIVSTNPSLNIPPIVFEDDASFSNPI